VKILVVADIHYSLPQFDWLLQTAPGYDVVIIAGDLLDTNSSVDLSTQIVVVLKYLKRLRIGSQLLSAREITISMPPITSARCMRAGRDRCASCRYQPTATRCRSAT
jgi:Icc-related predicted phosphoesterase